VGHTEGIEVYTHGTQSVHKNERVSVIKTLREGRKDARCDHFQSHPCRERSEDCLLTLYSYGGWKRTHAMQ